MGAIISHFLNNTPTDRAAEHKYLGVHIDESLKWHSHVEVITKKISAGLAVLKCISPFITYETRMSMYTELVMPYFNYWLQSRMGTSIFTGNLFQWARFCKVVRSWGILTLIGPADKSKSYRIGLPQFSL